MSLSFPSIWVPGSSFILASCLIGKEAISSILLDQCVQCVKILHLYYSTSSSGKRDISAHTLYKNFSSTLIKDRNSSKSMTVGVVMS